MFVLSDGGRGGGHGGLGLLVVVCLWFSANVGKSSMGQTIHCTNNVNNGAVLLPQTMGGSAGDDQLLDYFCPTDFAPRSRFPEPSVPNKPVSNKRVFCKQTSVLYPGSILLELWGGVEVIVP